MALWNALALWSSSDPLFFLSTSGVLEGNDSEVDSFVTGVSARFGRGLRRPFAEAFRHQKKRWARQFGSPRVSADPVHRLPHGATAAAAQAPVPRALRTSYTGIWDRYSTTPDLLRLVDWPDVTRSAGHLPSTPDSGSRVARNSQPTSSSDPVSGKASRSTSVRLGPRPGTGRKAVTSTTRRDATDEASMLLRLLERGGMTRDELAARFARFRSRARRHSLAARSPGAAAVRPSAEPRMLRRGRSDVVLLYLPPDLPVTSDAGALIERLSAAFAKGWPDTHGASRGRPPGRRRLEGNIPSRRGRVETLRQRRRDDAPNDVQFVTRLQRDSDPVGRW